MEVTWQDIEQRTENLQSVEGGFTAARRGIVTLDNGERVFIKQAVDSQTAEWIALEKKAYHWLAEQGYKYAPGIIAEGSDGFALPDLSTFDWSQTWSAEKLEAAFKAMTSLAALSGEAQGVFGHFKEPNHWLEIPEDIELYTILSEDTSVLDKTAGLLENTGLRQRLSELAATEPEQGDTLIHLDVRADNFCYDSQTKMGYLVDWNWLTLASATFDSNALLVSVEKSGFDVLGYCPDKLDAACLANLIGFWLAQAALPSDDLLSLTRHRHQFDSALTALKLYEALPFEIKANGYV